MLLLMGYTKLCNDPQRATTSHNEPQRTTTNHNEWQPTTTTHNKLQQAHFAQSKYCIANYILLRSPDHD